MRKINFIILLLLVTLSTLPFRTFAATQTGVEITSSYSDATTSSVNMILDYIYETPTGVYTQGFKVVYNKDQSIDGSKEATQVIWTGNLTLGDKGTKEGVISELSAGKTYDYDVVDVNPAVTDIYTYGQFTTLEGTGAGDDVPIVLTGDDTADTFDNSNCEEGKGEYCLLAPLPDPSAEGGLRTKTDTSFQLGDYINLMLKVIIGIAGVLAVVMIVIGGIQYMSTDAFSGKEEGKSRITNALLGLVLLVGSFMILNTINPNLVNFNLKIDSVYLKVTDADASVAPTLMGDGTYDIAESLQTVNGTAFTEGEPWPNDYDTGKIAALRDDITGKMLPVGSMDVTSSMDTVCLTVGQTGCTSVYYDATTALKLYNTLNQLRSACACNFTISGGSEYWLHKTHNAYSQVIDISLNATSAADLAKLNSYLTFGKSTTFPGGCSKTKLPEPFTTGFALAEDGSCEWGPSPHWHINFDDAS